MSNISTGQPITLTIDGTEYSALLREWETQLGARAGVATVTLVNKRARTFNAVSLRGKAATIEIADNQVFTGFVYGRGLGLSGIEGRDSDYVNLRLLDRRQLLNKRFIGQLHLGSSGLRMLGADIHFNANGKPNKDIDTGIYLATPVAPDFVYEKGNVDDEEDCEMIEADYWTWGDILYWIWVNYVDPADFDNPIDLLDADTIPEFGGLTAKAGEIKLLGGQVGGAIDSILSQTNASLTFNGLGVFRFFSRDMPVPLDTETLRWKAAGTVTSAVNYTEEYPIDFHMIESLEDVVTDVYIIGGQEQREIMTATYEHVLSMDLSAPPASPAYLDRYVVNATGTGDWAGHDNEIATWVGYFWGFVVPVNAQKIIDDDTGDGFQFDDPPGIWTNIGALADDYYPAEDYVAIDPNPAPPPFFLAVSGIVFITYWANYANDLRKHYRFSHVRYSSHLAGKDIRRKDQAKLITGELLIHRDKAGNYVPVDSECGVQPVSDIEGMSTYYSTGVQAEYDVGGVATYRDVAPNRWTHVVQMETRQYVTASVPLASLPTSVAVAVFRPEFVHKTREETKISVPVDIVGTVNGINGTASWTATPKGTTPAGATLDFDTSWSGFNTDPEANPPYDPTMTLEAGVVLDGIGPLNEISDVISTEIGRPAINCQGAYPQWKSLEVGTKIETAGVDFGIGTDQLIVAIHFDGATQQLSFVSTNHIGADALELARSFFVDRRRFQRNRV